MLKNGKNLLFVINNIELECTFHSTVMNHIYISELMHFIRTFLSGIISHKNNNFILQELNCSYVRADFKIFRNVNILLITTLRKNNLIPSQGIQLHL